MRGRGGRHGHGSSSSVPFCTVRFASCVDPSASSSNWKVKRKDASGLAAFQRLIYLSGVPRSFIRILTLLALLFAPAGMLASHAAMAAPSNDAPASMSPMHCAEMAPDDHQAPGHEAPTKNIDCAIACACLPPLNASAGDEGQYFVALAPVPNAQPLGHSFNPAADPPPPRLS